mgnify:CR=1 FL=1
MTVDFSAALRQEADQKFKNSILDALTRIEAKVDDLQKQVDALSAKKVKPEVKE